ncbi:MAG: SDR family oxidoreductase [Polyangiales bacterium]
MSKKTVVVTGGGAGIGAATARRFASLDYQVVVVGRTEAPLNALVSELGEDRAVAIPTDVSSNEACRRLVDDVIEKFDAIDVWVNNAGYNFRGHVDEVPPEQLQQIVDVNLRAPIFLTGLVLPHMKARNTGAIVNVASLAGRVPFPHEATYCATKFGLRAFTYALAEELRGTAVSASVVSPGPVDTGFIRKDVETVPNIVFSQPMSSADEIAELVVECALDGKVERCRPTVGAKMATMGYLFPSLRRALAPALDRKGAKNKKRFIEDYDRRSRD